MKKLSLLAIAAAATVLVSCGNKGGRPNFGDNEFPVQEVTTVSASMQTTYPATIKGIHDVEIRPKVSGFLVQINVHEGQTVSAGQTLFVIDNATYQAAVRQAQAAVNTATAQLNTAKLTYDNAQKLFANNVIGSYELESSRNAYESAQAQLAQAKASLASAQETLSFCYIKSPASGVIGNIPFKVGTLVSASTQQALTTVSDISSMEVYFSMTEKDILSMTKTSGSTQEALKEFPAVKLQLADGTTYNEEGRVTKMSGVIDAATGSVQLIANFTNPQRLLKSGGSGAIIIPRNNKSAIVIPQTVVSEVQNKKFVYLLGKDNKVKSSEITVEPQTDGNNYVVTSGLKVGDKYVTNGITKLNDGMEIVPITPKRYQEKIDEQAKAMTAGDIVKAIKK
jgi:membrane fusion protein (multidrug efflux system)